MSRFVYNYTHVLSEIYLSLIKQFGKQIISKDIFYNTCALSKSYLDCSFENGYICWVTYRMDI
jgi:hypothetical protein